ncbi:DUF6634 family protein [Tardiphaga sp. 619_E2_N8_5]|uniref:DUF6634 family protein n=1 Tax=unclassified Tardiphaga TaxID=2631404 RepID=UPI003F26CFBF
MLGPDTSVSCFQASLCDVANESHAMFIIKDNSPNARIGIEIERLKSLIRALELARNGKHPGRRALERAPVLRNWKLASRPEPCLTGTVTGHPSIKDGRTNRTSGLWLYSPAVGYARTLSRLYVLEDPVGDPGNFPQSF